MQWTKQVSHWLANCLEFNHDTLGCHISSVKCQKISIKPLEKLSLSLLEMNRVNFCLWDVDNFKKVNGNSYNIF